MLICGCLLGLTIPSHGESSQHGCTCVHARCAGRSARQTSCSPTRKAHAAPVPPSLLSVEPLVIRACMIGPRTLPFVSVFSAFFRKGQSIETFRGAGIYQPAVDLAIEKLRAGAWVRVPSRSFVLPAHHPLRPPERLHRFTFLRRVKSVNLTRTRRIRRRASRDCSASSGECAPVLLFLFPLKPTPEPYSRLYIIPPGQIIKSSF